MVLWCDRTIVSQGWAVVNEEEVEIGSLWIGKLKLKERKWVVIAVIGAIDALMGSHCLWRGRFLRHGDWNLTPPTTTNRPPAHKIEATRKHIQISMCHRFSCLRDTPHRGTRGTTRSASRRAFQWWALEILRTIIDLISVLQSSKWYFIMKRTEYLL